LEIELVLMAWCLRQRNHKKGSMPCILLNEVKNDTMPISPDIIKWQRPESFQVDSQTDVQRAESSPFVKDPMISLSSQLIHDVSPWMCIEGEAFN